MDTRSKLCKVCYCQENKNVYLPEPRPQKPCPCGSGRKSKSCCLKDVKNGYWLPPECVTKTPAPKTGFSHNKCYAKSLMDCCTKITREHYISESVLQVIGGKKALLASGFPRQSPNVQELMSINSLASKILCQRHNSALSPLDVEAKRLIATILNFDKKLGDSSCKGFSSAANLLTDEFKLFNGHSIERWMLKTVYGMFASKNVQISGKKVIEFTTNSSWTEIVFGTKMYPNGGGIYIIPSTTYASNSFGFAPLIFEQKIYDAIDYTPLVMLEDKTNVYAHGAQLQIAGFKFILSITGLMPEAYKSVKIYRPQKLLFTKDGSYKLIHFGWNNPFLKQLVTLERASRYSGRPPDQLGLLSKN